MDRISVLGGGSWGTTLANLLAAKDLNVSIWARDPKIFVKNKNTLINEKYLPKYKLSSKLKIQEDIKEAVLSANLIIIAIPSKDCLLYTSPSPRDGLRSRMPSSA